MVKFKITNGNTEVEFATSEEAHDFLARHQLDLPVETVEVVAVTPPYLRSDYLRFLRRVDAKGSILAEIAAENLQRVRLSIWSADQLKNLMDHQGIRNVVSCIELLAFEMAIVQIMELNIVEITGEIKQGWISKLEGGLFSQPQD